MGNLNTSYLKFSLFISLLIPMIIPSGFFADGMGRYQYGLPFPYVTIYQHEPKSMWLSYHFFAGNAGLSINPLYFIVNVIVLYGMIKIILKWYNWKYPKK